MTGRKVALSFVALIALVAGVIPAQTAFATAQPVVIVHGSDFEPDGAHAVGLSSMMSTAINASGDRVVSASNQSGTGDCVGNTSGLVVRWGLVQQSSTTWDQNGLTLPGDGVGACDFISETKIAISADGTNIAVLWINGNGTSLTIATLHWGLTDVAPTLVDMRPFATGRTTVSNLKMVMAADGSRIAMSWTESTWSAVPIGNYAVVDFDGVMTTVPRTFPTTGASVTANKLVISEDGEQVLLVTDTVVASEALGSQVVFSCSALCQPSKLKRYTLPEWRNGESANGSFSADMNRQGTRVAISWSTWTGNVPAATKVVVLDPRTAGTSVTVGTLPKASIAGSVFSLIFDSTGTRLAMIRYGGDSAFLVSAKISAQNAVTNIVSSAFPSGFGFFSELVDMPATSTTPERLVTGNLNSSAQIYVSESFANPKVLGLAGSFHGGGLGFALTKTSLAVSRDSGRIVFAGSFITIPEGQGWQQTAGVAVFAAKNVLVPSVAPSFTGAGTVAAGVTLKTGTWPSGSTLGTQAWSVANGFAPPVTVTPTGQTYRPSQASEMGSHVVVDFTVTKDGYYPSPVSVSSKILNGVSITPALAITGASGVGGAPTAGNTLAYSIEGSTPSYSDNRVVSWKAGTKTVGTGATLVVTPAMVGKVISLTVNYSSQYFTSVKKTVSTPVVVAAVH